MQKKYSKAVIKMVCNQVMAMYDNNIWGGCGCEGFEGWCEDGAVFQGDFEGEFPSEQDTEQAIELMHEVAPLVDDLTYKYFNLNGFGACEE